MTLVYYVQVTMFWKHSMPITQCLMVTNDLPGLETGIYTSTPGCRSRDKNARHDVCGQEAHHGFETCHRQKPSMLVEKDRGA
ncbi:hypothetical protein MTR67_029551, partial [Solanum verrucosum]